MSKDPVAERYRLLDKQYRDLTDVELDDIIRQRTKVLYPPGVRQKRTTAEKAALVDRPEFVELDAARREMRRQDELEAGASAQEEE